jgi:putative restriction endonuclease
MAYWWVSQNETYSHEVGGGYMWAPRKNDKGQTAAGWLTMTKVREGDIIFSFHGTFIKAVGIALSEAYEAEQPVDFAKKGEAWQRDGWRVDVMYITATNQFQPRNHMGLLGPLLPVKYSPLQMSGRGNQAYLFPVPDELGMTLLGLSATTIPNMPALRLDQLDFDHDEQDIIAADSLRETEKVTLVLARRGQGLFRSRVQTIEDSCRVTGLKSDKFLIASHIKPWKNSDNAERVDGNNGLFLSPHVDKLFDSGFISFSRSGEMLVSPKLQAEVLERWSIDPRKNYGRFNGDQAYFLDYHNEEKFIAA